MIRESKKELLEMLVRQLSEDSDNTERAAMSARQASIDAPGAMQSRYDSTKEEQGYLADAVNLRRGEIVGEALRLKGYRLKPSQVIEEGAFVNVLSDMGDSFNYFVLPQSGGKYIETNDDEVMVISTETPLFKAMDGKRKGDFFVLNFNDKLCIYEVKEVR